jgi:hypothetical protein
MKRGLVEYLAGGTSQPGNKINFLENKYLKGRPVLFNCSSIKLIYRVSSDFISTLQDLIPGITPSHKCHMNMGPILNSYIAKDRNSRSQINCAESLNLFIMSHIFFCSVT